MIKAIVRPEEGGTGSKGGILRRVWKCAGVCRGCSFMWYGGREGGGLAVKLGLQLRKVWKER